VQAGDFVPGLAVGDEAAVHLAQEALGAMVAEGQVDVFASVRVPV